MPTREDNLQAMQEAEEATVLLGLLRPTINQQVSSAVNLLIAHYRGESLKHDVMVGKIAEVAALTGLLSELEGRIRTGTMASEREFSNGSETKVEDGPRGTSRRT